MLIEEDKYWLQTAYPGLTADGNVVAGNIRFRAAYNAAANLFVIGEPNGLQPGYTILDCSFTIRIAEREAIIFSALPALYVEGLQHDPKRHISADGSGCLCSPFEEPEFLTPRLLFQPYFEKLVLPFLYGQTYFSLHQRWPWSEYSHRAAGILEAYSVPGGANKVEACLSLLKKCTEWPAIRSALLQRRYIKANAPCFCGHKRQIGRCHPAALLGLQQLRRQIIELGIEV